MGQVLLVEKPIMLVNFNPKYNPLQQVLKKFKKLKKRKLNTRRFGRELEGRRRFKLFLRGIV